MSTCATCRYFEEGAPNWVPAGFGSCNSPNVFYGYANKFSEMKPNQINVENDEGWGMVVGKDFGCVNHSAVCALEKFGGPK